MKKPEDQLLVIFGATGDLTQRKLMPALYALEVQKLLPEKFAIIGAGRKELDDESYRQLVLSGIEKYSAEKDKTRLEDFIHKIHYCSFDPADGRQYQKLQDEIQLLKAEAGHSGNTVYYLSTPPSLYGIIPLNLASRNMQSGQDGWKRVIIEKPFGYDLKSALELNASLKENWREDQIYRIDHYLGKETVQNVLVTRFSNGIFEPLWNRNYVHHVEITSAEEIGVEKRGSYYDDSGALRDMVQNHLLQLVALIAMEPPSAIDAFSIRNEVEKVFQSLRPIAYDEVKNVAIRGQYLESVIRGKTVAGYRQEDGVPATSKTETYVALKFFIDNWRWGGVPFYIRTGKRLPTHVTEAVVHFKPTPHYLFSKGDLGQAHNQLVLRIQPDEGMLLKFGMKTPGGGFEVQTVNMDFHYSELSNQRIPTAYERLLLDCMLGDATLFAREDAVLSAWKFLSPVIEAWKHQPDIPVFGYPAGTWGPENADALFEEEKITWRYPCKNLADDGIYCEL